MNLIELYKHSLIRTIVNEADKLSGGDRGKFKSEFIQLLQKYWPSGINRDELKSIISAEFPDGYVPSSYLDFYDVGDSSLKTVDKPEETPVSSAEEIIDMPDQDIAELFLRQKYPDKNLVQVTDKKEQKSKIYGQSMAKSFITKNWRVGYRNDPKSDDVYWYFKQEQSRHSNTVAYVYKDKRGNPVIGYRNE